MGRLRIDHKETNRTGFPYIRVLNTRSRFYYFYLAPIRDHYLFVCVGGNASKRTTLVNDVAIIYDTD